MPCPRVLADFQFFASKLLLKPLLSRFSGQQVFSLLIVNVPSKESSQKTNGEGGGGLFLKVIKCWGKNVNTQSVVLVRLVCAELKILRILFAKVLMEHEVFKGRFPIFLQIYRSFCFYSFRPQRFCPQFLLRTINI